jgi:hypothetical protein
MKQSIRIARIEWKARNSSKTHPEYKAQSLNLSDWSLIIYHFSTNITFHNLYKTNNEHKCCTFVLKANELIIYLICKLEQNWEYNIKASYLVTQICNISNASCVTIVGQMCGKLAYSNFSCQTMFTVCVKFFHKFLKTLQQQLNFCSTGLKTQQLIVMKHGWKFPFFSQVFLKLNWTKVIKLLS